MAYKTVAQLKDGLTGILTGINLNNVVNLNGALERTARIISTKIFIPNAIAKQNITLYDGVYDYTAPTDIFGAGLIDFRPQGNSRKDTDYVLKQPITVFDRTKADISNEYRLAFEFVQGIGRVRINSTVPSPKIELDSMTDTTGWAAAGSASGLTLDTTNYWNASGSLRFNLTGASTGTITKTIPSQDLTDYVGVGVIFLAMRTPSITNLTSIEARLGSSSSNYYSVSNTTGFLGAWTINEWLITAFDLSLAATTGTPIKTAINYAQIRVTHSGTITNFYVGDFWISLPSPHTMLYSSSAFFLASGSNPLQTITNVNDSIILNDAAYVIYELECAITIAQQQGGTMSGGMVATINDELNGRRARNGLVVQPGLYDIYRGNNPSQELRTIDNYYD